MHMCHLAQQKPTGVYQSVPALTMGVGAGLCPLRPPPAFRASLSLPLPHFWSLYKEDLSSCGSCLLCLQLSSRGMGDPSWGGWGPSFGTPFLSIPWARLGQPDSSHFPDPETGPPKGEVLAQGHAQGRGSHPHFGQNEAGLDQGQTNYEFPSKLGSASRIRGPP